MGDKIEGRMGETEWINREKNKGGGWGEVMLQVEWVGEQDGEKPVRVGSTGSSHC